MTQRHAVTLDAHEGESVTLNHVAELLGMRAIEPAHEGWPLGLLVDDESSAWRVGPAVEVRPLTIPVTRVVLKDLRFELTRLFALDNDLPEEGISHLPGLELAAVATIRLPSLSWPIVVDVGKAVAALAGVRSTLDRPAESGHVLRVLERSGALLRSEP